MGNFQVEPLADRRRSAIMTATLKLLGGKARGGLRDLVPVLEEVKPSRTRLGGIGIQPCVLSKYPLDIFKRSWLGWGN